MVSSCKKYISSFYFWVFLFIKQSRVKSSNFAAVYVHTDFSEHNDLRGFMVKLEGILKHVKIKDRRVEVKIIHFYDEYEYSTSCFFSTMCSPWSHATWNKRKYSYLKCIRNSFVKEEYMCGEMSTWQKIRQGYIFACIFSILLVKVIWKLNHDVSNFLSYCLLAAFFCFVSFAFVRYSFWFERLMPEERWFCTNKKYLILQCVIKSKVKGEKMNRAWNVH